MTSSSIPDALLALADVASVYEQCSSIAAQLTANATAQLQPPSVDVDPTARHDTTILNSIRPPAASRPAKKRPVPIELAQLDPAVATVAEFKKSKTAPKLMTPTMAAAATPAAASHVPTIKLKSKSKDKKPKRNSSLSHTPSFPAILMGMLSSPLNAQYISFLPDDQRFVILDPAAFESKLLPLHFEAEDENLYWNFTRTLDEWEFKSEPSEEYPGKDVYSHPLFKKGDWEGCLKITKPGSIKSAIDEVKAASLLKPIGSMPPLPSRETQMDSAQSLAFLNASLSKHMSATETSRILCNRYGLLNGSTKFQAMLSAQAAQNESSALQALMLQAQQGDISTLQAMMMPQHADLSSLQATMAAQQARSRIITDAVEALKNLASKPRTISPEFSQVASMFGNQGNNLDVMTELFIKHGMERMMGRQVMRSQMGQQGFGL
ncbi:hypothetical protein ACHAWO_007422 [Cyclotella atomus]|uniref:HSF-type DNA-binding domain-containing protein n=1 Tax=Cyclotella atomus TaxID=382360 RepID=A0ABD3QG96_9STRA